MSSTIIITLIVTMIVLFLRVPVGITLMLGGSIGLYLLFQQGAFAIIPQALFNTLNSFTLICLPLFMLMGVIIAKGGLGERVFDVFHAFLRHIPGGVGIGTILTCMLLAAMMGSSVAEAATVAPFAVKNLRRFGYSMPLAVGAVAAGGALGILIPPSGIMILYGVMTGESIGRLFMAGLFPGLVAGTLFCAYMAFAFRREKGGKVDAPMGWAGRWKALKRGYWGILIPLGIITSIYTGIATATEAAAVGCFLAILATFVFQRTLSHKDLGPLLTDAVTSISSLLIIIVGAVVFAAFVNQAGLSRSIAGVFSTYAIPLAGFLAITMIIMLVQGCFLEGVAICLIMVPILHPSVISYGYSLYVYAVLMTINIECALLTPPIGLNLFVVQGLVKQQGMDCTLEDTIRGVFPFFLLYLVTMVIVIIFPQLALWLPEHMYG